ncbi:MAG: hypothetical protein JXR88_10765 [Clostridia bacterium]|nr:hypothetical protein [Clostridia bacterium]
MGNLIDFNQAKSKVEEKQKAKEKVKKNNQKVISKVKNRRQFQINPKTFYIIIALCILLPLLFSRIQP